MFNEQAKSHDLVTAALATAKRMDERAAAKGYYTILCFDKNGNLKWEDTAPNLVVNVGLQDMNAQYFKGSAYTAAWYVGLITGPGSGTTIAAGDTMSSHAGWSENTGYSNATRPAATFGTATTANPSVQTNSASPASFTINATSTIAGAFLVSNSTKGGTTGILFSASDFTSPGDRAVVSGDTLNVTYTFSLTAT
jgi:hypothetical protein